MKLVSSVALFKVQKMIQRLTSVELLPTVQDEIRGNIVMRLFALVWSSHCRVGVREGWRCVTPDEIASIGALLSVYNM